MNQIEKRLKALETKTAPLGKFLFITRHKDESEEQAMAREGLTPKDVEEAARVFWVRFV